MKILIGGAWPYANGPLHIGHLASLLPGDVLARYHRARGDDVCYVSGSDCHGTPVTIRAASENTSPLEVSERYHREFCRCFEKLGFSYDLYGKTSAGWHKTFVREFHRTLYTSAYVTEKSSPQAYCEVCRTILTDRSIIGICPSCGEKARGDQCDACNAVLDAETLGEPKCAACGHTPLFEETKHLYIALSQLSVILRAYIDSHPEWRRNAVVFSQRYLDEGLRDRAITRDLDWGIEVPKEGYEDKKIYIWAENVLGYLSASKEALIGQPGAFEAFWGENARHYYVHGKDNIPFHTLILPALLLAQGDFCHLPDSIVSSEHVTLDGRKISTSKNHAVWVKDIADILDPDSLRYFFIMNGPEKRDADFTWNEYVRSHNNELLGAYGNFVNRSLVFIRKYLGGAVPEGKPNTEIDAHLQALYPAVGGKIEALEFRSALEDIFCFVRFANKYFDSAKPWLTRLDDPVSCADTLYHCVQLIANLAVLLSPFLPFSSAKLRCLLGLDDQWSVHHVDSRTALPELPLLFCRLDLDEVMLLTAHK